MAALEVRGSHGNNFVVLEDERYIVGRAGGSGILIDDPSVSALHAVFECIGHRWFVRDLDSGTGTFVNGDRLLGERSLRNDDSIKVGDTLLVYCEVAGSADGADGADGADASRSAPRPPPPLTPREREMLVELCRPVLVGNLFVEPTSVRDIAKAMFIGTAAVKQHISNASDKFGILPGDGTGESRRRRLAREAIQRGVITKEDLL